MKTMYGFDRNHEVFPVSVLVPYLALIRAAEWFMFRVDGPDSVEAPSKKRCGGMSLLKNRAQSLQRFEPVISVAHRVSVFQK